MSLSQALASAMSGLRTNQIALGLVSSNVANAETAGYIRKTSNQVAVSAGEYGSSVRTTGINRELDQYLQRQFRTEVAGSSYANLRSSVLNQLQSMYGTPGSAGTMETAFNNLTSALQALSTSSDSQSARLGTINAAQSLVQQLSSMTRGIQQLRSNAESGLADATSVANDAMQQIANINREILRYGPQDAATAALLDRRDVYINQLSGLMDINIMINESNQANVFTSSGVQLVGIEASRLSFDARGTVTANSQWNADPAKSALGTLSLTLPQGGTLDLTANNAIRSGKIAAYLELRDRTLVEAQTQLDQFAAGLASALSSKEVAGTAAGTLPQAGFDVDLSQLQSGNVVHLTYTDTITNTQHQVSIIRVDDPSVLPLPDSATNEAGDRVIGVDFSGGMASVVSQLNAALGPANISFFNPAGSTLRILDHGAGGLSDINAASATVTVTSMNGGDTQLPLFKDGGNFYTGAIYATGTQATGLAGRLSINPDLISDPSLLIKYAPGTPSGDTTRPNFLYAQLTSATLSFSAKSGLGTVDAPFKGTLLSFTQLFTSAQGAAANAAQMLSDGQNVVLSTLEQKMASTSGVNIDEEMAHLLALQNAYAANARVMSVVKEMYQTLMQAM